MHADCEFCVKRDICTRDVPKPCKYKYTEEERIADQMSTKGVLPGTYLPKTYKKETWQKEEMQMKATSTQEIKNVKDISFTVENYPMEEESKLTIIATTDDDIYSFVFEGPDILQSCKKSGLFTGWEKDQTIRELENQNKKILDTNRKLQEKIFHLEELKNPTIENFEEPSTRSDILKAAERCVCGQREQDYGTPESNFQLIADLWNEYLFPSLKENKAVISAKDVAMLMALMKIARIRNGGGSGDSFVDLAGYAACGGEIWAGEKKE